MFPDERSATKWFESIMWPGVRCCGHCGRMNTSKVRSAKPMPYWCTDCRSYFSVRTGTALSHTRIPLRKWAMAIYLETTCLKSVSSMKLHRDIEVTQMTAWFMLHRMREAWINIVEKGGGGGKFSSIVEVDETYMGGKHATMHKKMREVLKGRGTAGKSVVVGMKDRKTNRIRAEVVVSTDTPTLQGFVVSNTKRKAKVFTDDATAYRNLPRYHDTVRHSIGEYVSGVCMSDKRAHRSAFTSRALS